MLKGAVLMERPGRGKSAAGASRNGCSPPNQLCPILSNVFPHRAINVGALGWIRRTGQEENKGFVWLRGLFGSGNCQKFL